MPDHLLTPGTCPATETTANGLAPGSDPVTHYCNVGAVIRHTAHVCTCGHEWGTAVPLTSDPETDATPEGVLSYALGHAERAAAGESQLAAADVLAGITELGWSLTPSVDLPELTRSEVITVHPGDIVVYNAIGPVSDQQLHNLRRVLEGVWPNNRVMVAENGATISTVRPGHVDVTGINDPDPIYLPAQTDPGDGIPKTGIDVALSETACTCRPLLGGRRLSHFCPVHDSTEETPT
jgi:hypothetical protein